MTKTNTTTTTGTLKPDHVSLSNPIPVMRKRVFLGAKIISYKDPSTGKAHSIPARALSLSDDGTYIIGYSSWIAEEDVGFLTGKSPVPTQIERNA